MLLSAIGGRAASDEAQTTSMIGQRLGLRGQNIDSTLSLDAQRRNLELDPIQKLMAGGSGGFRHGAQARSLARTLEP